jgi:hypothetical protein
MHASANVRSKRNQRLIRDERYRYVSEYLSASEWTLNSAENLKATAREGYRRIAEAIIDDLLLIQDFSATLSGHHGSGSRYAFGNEISLYAPIPISPRPTDRCGWDCLAGTFGSLIFERLDSLRPKFFWEISGQLANGIAIGKGSSNEPVVYDFRIYRASLFSGKIQKLEIEGVTPTSWANETLAYWTDGRLVYRKDRIGTNHHKLDQDLDKCTHYLWTVRARFNIDGYPRATEWSGAYLPEHGPGVLRHGGGPNTALNEFGLNVGAFFYPFSTPCS